MSDTGHQSPIGINVSGSVLQNIGLRINPIAAAFLGTSKTNSTYTPGTLVENTCLKWLTYGINSAWNIAALTDPTYDDLISIGSGSIPALGNSIPPTYTTYDPAGNWSGEATTGYYLDTDPGAAQGQSQTATWIPYSTANTNKSITQWGFLRLYALQAWNEFNWNGIPASTVEYKDFITSFVQLFGYIENVNKSIQAAQAGKTFNRGTYSTMNDLMSANISGVNLATFQFGQDCVAAGKVVDLSKIAKFGYPSVLLQTIAKYNILTQPLSLALLSSGISVDDLNKVAAGAAATKLQEQQLYGAFLVITGNELRDVLIPLNCKTVGLRSLADLLDIKKLFPNSYGSMTVPIYNTSAGPTNSKTYYLIFENGAVSPRLTSPTVKERVGTIIIPSAPASTGSLNSTIQVQDKGFGASLYNILPEDIAISAGAFAYSMQQITNIRMADFERFSQVVYNLESAKGLNLVDGTNTPTNPELAAAVISNTAHGSGVNGSYTMSDFFGCMSGLPYMWNDVYSGITSLQSPTLTELYQNLYLACTWERATLTIDYTGTGPYTVTAVTINNPGGGYGRDGAPPPIITANCGTGTLTIGTDPNDLSTYGKVTGIDFAIGAQPQGPLPDATVDYPPGGSSYPEADIIIYIASCNAEIEAIASAKPTQAANTNIAYDLAGTQLNMEQRSRFNALAAVPSPVRSTSLSPFPSTLFTFVDLIPLFSTYSTPHMYAQTLEAISDLTTVGGESIVAMMRQSRNQARLQELGITPDNNVPDDINIRVKKLLLANGTAPGALSGISVNGINGTPTPTIFSVPSTLIQTDSDGNAIAPSPLGYFDPNKEDYCLTAGASAPGQVSPLQEILASGQHNVNNTNILGPSLNGTGPSISENIVAIRAGTSLPSGPCVRILDIGKAIEPGSLAGSTASNLVPVSLNTAYTSGTLLPASFTVAEAINNVIACNCDCWVD